MQEMLEKNEVRRRMRQRRAAIPPEEKKQTDAAIVENIRASVFFQNASMLLLYAPMEGEVNLLPLARLFRRAGKPIAFPRCDKETNTMSFYVLSEDARLTPGAYDIPEPPADAPLCIPDEHALCLLPGLAFDPHGNRLGYGKGYYDRYLAAFPGVTVGVIPTAMMLREVPTDAHDIPARYIATERGIWRARKTDVAKEAAPVSVKSEAAPEDTAPAKKISLRERVQGILSFLRAFCREKNTENIRAPHMPVILVLITFLMLLLSHLIDTQLLNRDSEYIGVILLQILIFVLPAVLYCKLRGEKFSKRIRLSPIKPQHFLLLLWMLCVMASGSLLLSILTGGIESLSGGFTLYNTFMAHTSTPTDILYSILAYAILPAFGEELIYRSILCAEYESRGVAVSVTVSALFFAMLHFSFPLFPAYLFLGALLALSMYATRSFLAPLLLHLCYNLFCLFGRPYLSAFYVHAGSHETFLFCLGILFLLSAALAAGEARKIYHIYAVKNADASYTVPLTRRAYPKTLFFSLLSPVTAACLLIWLVTSIVNLF